MTTTASSPSTAIAVVEPVITPHEELALTGFLAGYTGLTREAYALDLRQFTGWCQERHLRLFQARRADIECFARDLEAKGRVLVAAGLGAAAEHALISLLALNGLRVSEATGACIEALGTERGHRILTITRKGGKVVISRSPRGPPGRSTWPSANAAKDLSSWLLMVAGWTGTAPPGSSTG